MVAEGERGARKVYRSWINFVNPSLTYVDRVDEISHNSYVIYAGFGYPFYFQIIEDAIRDVNSYGNVDRLVIGVDSEDMSHQEKYDEIASFVNGSGCKAEIHIVVQHFCLETWALGNRIIFRRNPHSLKLRLYLQFFDVRMLNPELLPSHEGTNRAQFAVKYLKAALNERYGNLSYSKNDPKVLLNALYFERVKQRFYDTGHIPSFEAFLSAFV